MLHASVYVKFKLSLNYEIIVKYEIIGSIFNALICDFVILAIVMLLSIPVMA